MDSDPNDFEKEPFAMYLGFWRYNDSYYYVVLEEIHWWSVYNESDGALGLNTTSQNPSSRIEKVIFDRFIEDYFH